MNINEYTKGMRYYEKFKDGILKITNINIKQIY